PGPAHRRVRCAPPLGPRALGTGNRGSAGARRRPSGARPGVVRADVPPRRRPRPRPPRPGASSARGGAGRGSRREPLTPRGRGTTPLAGPLALYHNRVAADASERVFLVGMVGAGKTTIGHALSERTGWPYIDNDDLVKSMTGRDSAEIFETDGEDVLHLAEIQALDVAFGTDPPLVVGVAGAVVGDAAAREALREGGYVVWLRAR